ncbi:MAG: ribokinase [Clostridia bacterium]|nr:ribokinase [Clostridia bacterium]MBP3652291.1 ribokinase [Clostridia bacterium]
MSKNCIAVFGDLLYDCFIWSDRLPRVGETVTGYASGFFASGKGGNQAATCARLGAQVYMLGKVGADERGKILLDTMLENSVNVDGVVVSQEHPTGTDCVLVAKDGKNAIVVAPNANATVTAEEVEGMRPYFEKAGSALFQLQINSDAVECAMRLARECGCKVVLNPAPACEIPDSMFALADYVTPNETEAEFFTGIRCEGMDLAEWREKAAKAMHDRGVKTLIITMGEHGAYYSGPDGAFMMPAFKINPVDSTAAGDAFNGGFAVSIAAGKDVKEAMRYGSACGAITTMRRGSMPSLPNAEEVEQFIKEHKEV